MADAGTPDASGAADVPDDHGGLAAIGEPVRRRIVERYQARELGLTAARDATRSAANAIRAVHRGDRARADALIAEARDALRTATDACAPHPEVANAGFVADAAKEVAEAVLTAAAVAGEALGGPGDIEVDDVSWLHGLAETVGELRRACLDHVRAGELVEAERLLALMQEILGMLATIDVPDGLTRGLRRATDAARAITERTRGDITTAAGQRALQDALDAHRDSVERLLYRDEPR